MRPETGGTVMSVDSRASERRQIRGRGVVQLLLVAALVLSSLAVMVGPTAAPADAATSGSYLMNISIVEGSGTACPAGYSRDGTNLNSEAPGADLYACWDFGEDPAHAIRHIDVRNTNSCPSGYGRVGPD